jgi:hypothetical protein
MLPKSSHYGTLPQQSIALRRNFRLAKFLLSVEQKQKYRPISAVEFLLKVIIA